MFDRFGNEIKNNDTTKVNAYNYVPSKENPEPFQCGGVQNATKVLTVCADGYVRPLRLPGVVGGYHSGSNITIDEENRINVVDEPHFAGGVYSGNLLLTAVSGSVSGTSLDIINYITINGVEHKLGGGSSYTAGAFIDITGDVISAVDVVNTTETQYVGGSKTFTNVSQWRQGDNFVELNPGGTIYSTSTIYSRSDIESGTTIKAPNILVKGGDLSVQSGTDIDFSNANSIDLGSKAEVETPTSSSTSKSVVNMEFVNSSIETSLARYLTYDAAGNPFPTKAAFTSATTFYYGGVVTTPDDNDYIVILADESKQQSGQNAPSTKYSYQNNTWSYLYVVNNSGFTASQWNAINSGATAQKIARITGDFITTRNISTSSVTVQGFHSTSIPITAPTVSGYTFVCWVGVASWGGVATQYIANYASSSTTIWLGSYTSSSVTCTATATALYIKSE